MTAAGSPHILLAEGKGNGEVKQATNTAVLINFRAKAIERMNSKMNATVPINVTERQTERAHKEMNATVPMNVRDKQSQFLMRYESVESRTLETTNLSVQQRAILSFLN